jgi:putative ABC transport system substrate-binding protein
MNGAERKRVGILKEMLPNISRIAAITNLSNPSRQAEWREVEATARDLSVEPRVLDVRVAADIERSFDLARSWDAGALVGSDTLIQTNQSLVIQSAASHRLPAIYTFRDFVDAGGLVSYGASLADLYRRAAGYVDKILLGVQPRDFPIEPGGDLELVINATTASSPGIAVSAAMASRAHMVE